MGIDYRLHLLLLRDTVCTEGQRLIIATHYEMIRADLMGHFEAARCVLVEVQFRDNGMESGYPLSQVEAEDLQGELGGSRHPLKVGKIATRKRSLVVPEDLHFLDENIVAEEDLVDVGMASLVNEGVTKQKI